MLGVGLVRAHGETLHIERVVPAGAALTYTENGQVIRRVDIPPGLARVTVEYGLERHYAPGYGPAPRQNRHEPGGGER